jgi:hypothetical protein
MTSTNKKDRPKPETDYLYFTPEQKCRVCLANIQDYDPYWLHTPCCGQKRAICYYCFTDKFGGRVIPFGEWSNRHRWCKCPLCRAVVNLSNNDVVRDYKTEK